MKNMRPKKDGFFIDLSAEDRQLVDFLKERAVNISQAFRLFLRALATKENRNDG